jgi:hypothetical protein
MSELNPQEETYSLYYWQRGELPTYRESPPYYRGRQVSSQECRSLCRHIQRYQGAWLVEVGAHRVARLGGSHCAARDACGTCSYAVDDQTMILWQRNRPAWDEYASTRTCAITVSRHCQCNVGLASTVGCALLLPGMQMAPRPALNAVAPTPRRGGVGGRTPVSPNFDIQGAMEAIAHSVSSGITQNTTVPACPFQRARADAQLYGRLLQSKLEVRLEVLEVQAHAGLVGTPGARSAGCAGGGEMI